MHVLDKTFQKNASFVFRRIADEVILIPVQRRVDQVESLYTLNEVAARVWELLDGARRLQEVRDTIVMEFEVNETEAQEDLAALIEQLTEIEAITEVVP